MQPNDTLDFPDAKSSRFLFAALFDGHAGSHAADWLNTRLYELFSEAINEEIVDEGEADEACEVEGNRTRSALRYMCS